MNKIWFFGDSYIADRRPYISSKSWTLHVTEAFPKYESENLAFAGSSLDHMYTIYNENRDNFKKGDIVILTLTSHNRLFLSSGKTKPNFLHSSFRMLDNGRFDVQEDEKYYGYFASDFFNIRAQKSIKNLVVDAFQYDVIEKGIKLIILPIDDTVLKAREHVTIGMPSLKINLIAVTRKNYETLFSGLEKGWHNRPEVKAYDETLANHLTPENNKVLANKIIQALKTDAKTIDLTTDWIS
jgi:hypothetical protein